MVNLFWNDYFFFLHAQVTAFIYGFRYRKKGKPLHEKSNVFNAQKKKNLLFT